jgi:hypothetical protein
MNKDKPHVTNVAIVEDPLNLDNGDDLTKEMTFYAFFEAHTLKTGRDLVLMKLNMDGCQNSSRVCESRELYPYKGHDGK